jgi:hypothetical protein
MAIKIYNSNKFPDSDYNFKGKPDGYAVQCFIDGFGNDTDTICICNSLEMAKSKATKCRVDNETIAIVPFKYGEPYYQAFD